MSRADAHPRDQFVDPGTPPRHAVDRYRTAEPFVSRPAGRSPRRLAPSADPPGVVRAVSNLLVHPMWGPMRGLLAPDAAVEDRKIRSVESILARLVERGATDLTSPRPPDARACVRVRRLRARRDRLSAYDVPARCHAASPRTANRSIPRITGSAQHWDGRAGPSRRSRSRRRTGRGARGALGCDPRRVPDAPLARGPPDRDFGSRRRAIDPPRRLSRTARVLRCGARYPDPLGPAVRNGSVSATTLDIAPTVLELAGIPATTVCRAASSRT